MPIQNPPFSSVFPPYISIEREPWILLFSFHKSRRRRPSHTVFVLRALSDIIKRTNTGAGAGGQISRMGF